MTSMELRLELHSSTSAQADRDTSELQQMLRSRQEVLSVARLKVDDESQDAGSILVAALAAPAAVQFAKGPALELARGIADWLRKRRVTVSITGPGTGKVENVRPEDAERVIVALLQAERK